MDVDDHKEGEYILGTHEDEAFRLGLQHSLWSEYAHAIWKRAGISWGDHVLDAGCGPGFATLDLARIVGATGHVHGLEYSPVFVKSLEETLSRHGVPGVDPNNVTVEQADLQEVDLNENIYDAAYLRWVLCFIPDPAAAIANIARAIKPNGRIVIQDYASFDQVITLFPPSQAFDRVVKAFHDGWVKSRGNPKIGIELPALLHRAGFEVEETKNVSFALRPQDSLWRWPESFFPIVAKSLVEKGAIQEQDRQDFLADWRARSLSKESLFCTPNIIEIIAKKL